MAVVQRLLSVSFHGDLFLKQLTLSKCMSKMAIKGICHQERSYNLLWPNHRSGIVVPMLYSVGQKQVTTFSPHANGGIPQSVNTIRKVLLEVILEVYSPQPPSQYYIIIAVFHELKTTNYLPLAQLLQTLLPQKQNEKENRYFIPLNSLLIHLGLRDSDLTILFWFCERCLSY